MTDKYTPTEMMTIAAARALRNDDVCFVGIGAPSAACNLARLTHAPDIVLIYESGTIETKPNVLPLSIGDGELCETALFTVPVPEMFRYWLQGGRITTGFLGGAQIDKFANLNTTVVGPYEKPAVRLPGGGGAPEIATNCGRIFITMSHSKRTFVEKLDFITSLGHGTGGDDRKNLGLTTEGPTKVMTDLCVFEARSPGQRNSRSCRCIPASPANRVIEATALGGEVFRKSRSETPPPTELELMELRALHARTAANAKRPGGRHIAIMRDAYICDFARTPIGRYGGSLSKVRTDDLAAIPIKALIAQCGPSTGRHSTRSSSAAPIRRARTTATSRAWRSCSRASPTPGAGAPRSTASAPPASMPSAPPRAPSRPASWIS
jgi:glutaconate CoA-transferase, subunit B